MNQLISSREYFEIPEPVDICGLPISPLSQVQLIDTLIGRAKNGIRTRAHYLNAHTFNLAKDLPEFHNILATTDLLYADGISVVWAGRWLGHRIPERLSAADYFEKFCQQCVKEAVSLFFLGGVEGVSEKAADNLAERVPGLQVAGTHGGYFPREEASQVIEKINTSKPDILLVGMGAPQQEIWLVEHASEIEVPVCWTVGALFDYFAGREPRAPQWLCRYGGEWIFRFLHKPQHRWQRYLMGNTRFLLSIVRELKRQKQHSLKSD